MFGKNGKISKVPSTESEALSSSKYTAYFDYYSLQ